MFQSILVFKITDPGFGTLQDFSTSKDVVKFSKLYQGEFFFYLKF